MQYVTVRIKNTVYSWITAPFTSFIQDYLLRHQPSKSYLKHGTGVSIFRNTSALIFLLNVPIFTKSINWRRYYQTLRYIQVQPWNAATKSEFLMAFLPSSAKNWNSIPVFRHCKLAECVVGVEGIHSKCRHILNEVRSELVRLRNFHIAAPCYV